MAIELGHPTRTVVEIRLTAESPDEAVRRSARLMASSYLSALEEQEVSDDLLIQALRDVIEGKESTIELASNEAPTESTDTNR